MSTPLRIDRKRSALGDGTLFGRRRRGLRRWQVIAAVLAVGGLAYLYFNIQAIEPLVLTVMGQAPSATPENAVYAQRGYAAYLNGNLESAIDDYCRAAHGIPVTTFTTPATGSATAKVSASVIPPTAVPAGTPRCRAPEGTDAALVNVDPNVAYELIRTLIYRSFDDRRLDPYNLDAATWGKLMTNLYPNNSRLHAIYAFALVNNSKPEQAVPEALNAISLDANNADAHAYLSMAYYYGGRNTDALIEAQNALKLDQNSLDAHIAAAQAYEFNAQWNAAQAEFETATQIEPRLEFPYFYAAAFFLYRNQQPAAIAEYDQVLAMDNRSVKAYTRKCATYFNTGDTGRALSSCKNATILDPNYPEAWKWQGQVLYNQRDYEDATTAFETCRIQEQTAVNAKQILPVDQFPECWYLGGLTWYLRGKCEKAYPLFNEMLSFSNNDLAIKLTGQGIDYCSKVDPSIKTPTPLPSPTVPPAPIY